MRAPDHIARAAEERVVSVANRIQRSIRAHDRGIPLAAEEDPVRLEARLCRRSSLTRSEAAAMAAGIQELGRQVDAGKGGPERIWGPTIDFVGVSFLDRGRAAARSVARVASRQGAAIGSGFLISDRLFVTNNHVIGSAADAGSMMLEFDYELSPDGARQPVTSFGLDPDVLFLTNETNDLDYTLVAVGDRISGAYGLGDFGWSVLSDASDKHALGEVANIVQHPDGRFKEVVLRENRLVSRLDTVLHYLADTEPGSSGSPVYNNEWQVIALHHWGGPWRQQVDDQGRLVPREINEGIRISAIVKDLERKAGDLGAASLRLLDGAIRLGESGAAPPPPITAPAPNATPGVAILENGTARWTIPLELAMRVPHLGEEPPDHVAVTEVPSDLEAERRVVLDTNYDNRSGYRADFIEGHRIELPRLNAHQRRHAARLLETEPGEDPFELKYEHFSVVVNGRRRLAYFTACNTDGPTAKDVNRRTGAVTTPRRDRESLEAAEAREKWFIDERIRRDQQTNQDLYDGQLPGVRDRISRMFQRGHLVRRKDPAWGRRNRVLRADADTYHFSNCTPQVGFFNQGTAPDDMPDSGNGRLWRAIEDYVLGNAVDSRERVTVFTGPILNRNDPRWRDHLIPRFRVPRRFYKIVVWPEGDRLRSTAMIADQSPFLDDLPENRVPEDAGPEAFRDRGRVRDFLTTVRTIERATRLDFGDAVRDADLRGRPRRRGAESRAEELRPVDRLEEIPLTEAEARTFWAKRARPSKKATSRKGSAPRKAAVRKSGSPKRTTRKKATRKKATRKKATRG